MTHFDQTSATCLVFTFKEGVLSAVAHDLRLRCARFTIDVERGDVDAERRVEARFDLCVLAVDQAMRQGRPQPGALSAEARREIDTRVGEILAVEKFPEARFVGAAIPAPGGFHIVGDLTLRGVTRRIETTSREDGGALVAEVTLHQPDFGIKPYAAMFGALKLKPDVMVQVRTRAE